MLGEPPLDTPRRGYADNDGEWIREAAFAAVAVPAVAGRRLLGAIDRVFPKAAVARTAPAATELSGPAAGGVVASIAGPDAASGKAPRGRATTETDTT
jgi:hypothetical protein